LDGIALDGEDARGGRDVPVGLVDVADDGGSEVELLRQIIKFRKKPKASAHGVYSSVTLQPAFFASGLASLAPFAPIVSPDFSPSDDISRLKPN
jgi:hypothetical protein